MEPELEKTTQADIIKFLLSKDVMLLRVNSVVARIGKRFIRSVIQCGREENKGVSDLIGCTKYGIFIAIEVKRKGEKPTEEQISFLNYVKEHQGKTLLAYSLEEVIAWYGKEFS